MRLLVLIVLSFVSTLAAAHPGHGETLHAHPELWLVVVAVASVIAYARRKVVA